MKKIKYLLLMLLLIPFIIKAENIDIKDVDEYYSGPKGILYSNNKLYVSKTESNITTNKYYDNVKKFDVMRYYNIIYLTNDGKVVYYDKQILENIKDIITVDGETYDFNDLYYIDNDDNLYGKCLSDYWCSPIVSDTEMLIKENVKKAIAIASDYDTITLLYLTNDNELYFIGKNYFGSKINSGNNTTTSIKLLDNIVDFGYRYAINENNDLYIFSETDPRPTVYYSNVKKFIVDEVYEYNNIYNRNFAVETNDNKNILLYFDDGEFKSSEIGTSVKKIVGSYILTSDGKVYYKYRDMTTFVDEDVIDINIYNSMFIYLKNNGEVYSYDAYNMRWDNKYSVSEALQKLYIGEYANKPILYLKNVKSIKFAHKNFIILNNNEILRIGDGKLGIFFGEPYINSLIPIQINEYINNDKEIKVNQIYLSVKDVYDYTLGDEFDVYATAIPYNSTNKELIWESSDSTVAEVNDEGYVVTKKVGTATINVKTSDNSVSNSVTINVYPKVSNIEITNGEIIEVGKEERILLNVNVTPENTIKKGIKWEILDDISEYDAYLNDYYYDDILSSSIHLNNNQRIFRAYKGGTYRVKVTSEDNIHSDIITINVVEKVEYIELNIPKSNYDGYNAFIFLFEDNKLQVDAIAKYDSANNKELRWSSSNTAVAEVSQTGLITGKKAGRSVIKVESVDGGASKQFNVIVYDSNGYGSLENEEKITSNPKITITRYKDSQVLLNVNKIDNATSYDIYRSTSKTKNYKKMYTITDNSYLDTIPYGTTYYYKVIAKNSKYKSGYSNIVSIKVLPDKVNNLTSDNVTSTSIKLNYDKVNTTGYEVYYGTSTKKMKKATTITKNDTLTYTKTGLKTNTTYYFKVRAYKTVGKKKIYGSYSTILKVKTSPAKSKLTITNSDYNSLSISMSKVSGASKYILEMSNDNVTFNKLGEYTTNSSYNALDLETGKTYYFRINVCNSDSNCSGYNLFSKKVIPKTPNLSLKTASKKVTINVSSVNGVDGYEIYRSNYSNKKFTLIKEFTTEDEILEFIDSTKKGKTYYYKVRAYKTINNEKIYSSYSSVKKIKSK